MVKLIIIFLSLFITLDLYSQRINCWFCNGEELSITPYNARFSNGDILHIEAMQLGDDLFDVMFITDKFKYWFARQNGQVLMIVSPKQPYWLNINDKRNRKFQIQKYQIAGKWN